MAEMIERQNNIAGAYRFYRKSEKSVNREAYHKIISLFMQFIMSKIFSGIEVKLPARLGSVQIVGRKVKPRLNDKGDIVGLAPNWPETKKLWDSNAQAKERKEIVYCFNEHSLGIRYKFLWSKKDVLVKNKSVYTLKFSRTNKREVNRLIKEGKEFYTI